MFDAIYIEGANAVPAHLARLGDHALPEGDVTVGVTFSTLNYKDALAITGRGPVVRRFPMVPGIDFAGVVEASDDPGFRPGDTVLLTGWGVGETHWGGLAQRARVKAEWLVKMPPGLTPERAMAVGTAGLTAMLSVMALERHGTSPDQGDILVTGAGGGVGGIATALLHRLGYRVFASTGRPAEADYLHRLGAAEVLDRATLSQPGKPLGKERWAAVIDSAGSHTLANACAATRYGGVVAACGLAQGMDFPTSVAPFILRGVSLAGIESVYCPGPVRTEAWRRIADLLDFDAIGSMFQQIELGAVPSAATALLNGQVRGRVVVKMPGAGSA